MSSSILPRHRGYAGGMAETGAPEVETIGKLVMKTQSRMRRLLDEIEEQQTHLHDVIPLGPGLANATENLLGCDGHSSDKIVAIYGLVSWSRVLGSIDEMHRLYTKQQDGAETARGTAVTPKSASRSAPSWWDEQPTPLADELPEGVDDLSPEARRTVLDLLRVLVVAETGSGPR